MPINRTGKGPATRPKSGPEALAEYEARLRALMARRPIKGVTTDQLMEESRGEMKAKRRSKK
jgi:hypothetical protein